MYTRELPLCGKIQAPCSVYYPCCCASDGGVHTSSQIPSHTTFLLPSFRFLTYITSYNIQYLASPKTILTMLARLTTFALTFALTARGP